MVTILMKRTRRQSGEEDVSQPRGIRYRSRRKRIFKQCGSDEFHIVPEIFKIAQNHSYLRIPLAPLYSLNCQIVSLRGSQSESLAAATRCSPLKSRFHSFVLQKSKARNSVSHQKRLWVSTERLSMKTRGARPKRSNVERSGCKDPFWCTVDGSTSHTSSHKYE